MVEFHSGAAGRDPACPLRAQNRPERYKSLRYAPNRALHSSIISRSSYTPLAEPLKTRNQLIEASASRISIWVPRRRSKGQRGARSNWSGGRRISISPNRTSSTTVRRSGQLGRPAFQCGRYVLPSVTGSVLPCVTGPGPRRRCGGGVLSLWCSGAPAHVGPATETSIRSLHPSTIFAAVTAAFARACFSHWPTSGRLAVRRCGLPPDRRGSVSASATGPFLAASD